MPERHDLGGFGSVPVNSDATTCGRDAHPWEALCVTEAFAAASHVERINGSETCLGTGKETGSVTGREGGRERGRETQTE